MITPSGTFVMVQLRYPHEAHEAPDQTKCWSNSTRPKITTPV